MGPVKTIAALLVICCTLFAPAVSRAADAALATKDWPQFLGPTRDGVYAGDIAGAFPAGGPRVAWKMDVGEGWAAPVVADGKTLIFHRVKNEAVLDCLDAATGKPIWGSAHPTDYTDGFGFDPGPRATPVVADGRVFTFGAEGTLRAVELATGKEIWAIDAVKQYKAQRGYFGLACSPIVEGDRLIVQIGGKAPSSVVVALDVRNGRQLWGSIDVDADGNTSEAGYSSPTIATIGGKRYVISVNRRSFNVIDVASGKVVTQLPFHSRQQASVNAATPLVVGDEVFLSASYDVGAKLLKLDPANPAKPQVVWENDESMSNHYAPCVYRVGMLYGFHGRQEQGPELRCVEWKTGKVRWRQEDLGAGTVTLAGDKLLVLTEGGILIMAAASPEGFKELGRARVLGAESRAYPAIAGGMLYARGKDRLVCVELTK
jgi:outer membrane protein assembly factor BamB